METCSANSSISLESSPVKRPEKRAHKVRSHVPKKLNSMRCSMSRTRDVWCVASVLSLLPRCWLLQLVYFSPVSDLVVLFFAFKGFEIFGHSFIAIAWMGHLVAVALQNVGMGQSPSPGVWKYCLTLHSWCEPMSGTHYSWKRFSPSVWGKHLFFLNKKPSDTRVFCFGRSHAESQFW